MILRTSNMVLEKLLQDRFNNSLACELWCRCILNPIILSHVCNVPDQVVAWWFSVCFPILFTLVLLRMDAAWWFFCSFSNFWFLFLLLLINAVYTCNWYMEYRVHLCWGINWEATFTWEKCCSPARFDDWFAWYTFVRHHLSGMLIKTFEQFWTIKTWLLLTSVSFFLFTGSKWKGKKILN